MPKITAFVPGSDKYNTTFDWNKKMPHVTQRMSRAAKVTYIEEIFKKGKSPEKSTPSPMLYLKEKAFDKTQALRTIGCPKSGDERTTFVVEKEVTSNFTPAPNKYNAIDTVSELSANCTAGPILSPNPCH